MTSYVTEHSTAVGHSCGDAENHAQATVSLHDMGTAYGHCESFAITKPQNVFNFGKKRKPAVLPCSHLVVYGRTPIRR